MEATIEQILNIIDNNSDIVFFGGAGISTESGIPDFRSTDGLYNQEYDYPPETILSASFFKSNPKEFYRFYKNKCLKPMLNSKPNATHIALAKLEEIGKLNAIVTQNIDDLHHKAGSKNIYELHGTSFRNYCIRCGKEYSIEDVMSNTEDYMRCECGGIVRPDIVLYEEGLDNSVISKSIKAISEAKVLIIAGTSLIVYPAAGLINYYNGDKLILINKDKVKNEDNIDYVYHGLAGDIFRKVLDKYK